MLKFENGRWEKIRRKGKLYYVAVYGIGVSLITWFALELLYLYEGTGHSLFSNVTPSRILGLVLFIAIGVIFGLRDWSRNELLYQANREI